MQAYSDPKRENDKYSLPDVEVFEQSADDFLCADPGSCAFEALCEYIGVKHDQRGSWIDMILADGADNPVSVQERIDEIGEAAKNLAGWYWWSCFPGCLPDSDPIGPFASEAEALADAQAEAQ